VDVLDVFVPELGPTLRTLAVARLEVHLDALLAEHVLAPQKNDVLDPLRAQAAVDHSLVLLQLDLVKELGFLDVRGLLKLLELQLQNLASLLQLLLADLNLLYEVLVLL